MQTFQQIFQQISEGLGYKIPYKELTKIADFSKYKVSKNKNGVDNYSVDGEVIFSYDKENERLIIKKNGWQLMNIKRGW